MVAKLVIAVIALVALVTILTIVAYRYFDAQAERQHEKEMQQMEHTERMVDVAERDRDDL